MYQLMPVCYVIADDRQWPVYSWPKSLEASHLSGQVSVLHISRGVLINSTRGALTKCVLLIV